MGRKIKGLVIAFEENVDEEDVQAIINAVGMVRGVLKADEIEADLAADWVERERVNATWRRKLLDLVRGMTS